MSLITPQEAQARMLAEARLLPAEIIPYGASLGRVLREDLRSDRPFPPFDRVTMDGIAFRSLDQLPGTPLLVQGTHPAGQPAPPPLKPGHCWQIMTGAVLPPDCDTIVPIEEVTLTESTALVRGQPTPGSFIHRCGSDAPAGTVVLKSGTRLGPAHLGLLATVGATEVKVTRLPCIHVLTTGDELIPVEEIPKPHQLRQSNGPTLLAAIDLWGPAERTWQHLPDDLESITRAIEAALQEADLLLLSGGISKGTRDYVRPALESLIGPPVFHGVAQRPGKPLAYWPGVVALPGNPNSTLTTFQRYVAPLLHRLTGSPEPEPTTLPLVDPVKPHSTLTLFLPATLAPDGRIRPLSPQNSGDFLTPLQATGLVEIPPGRDEITTARYLSISPARPS